MKKVLTTLLLLTFCTAQATMAGDVIIIGSDGQARYEDGRKNIPVTQNVIENTKQKNILNEITVTDSTGRKESIYIDYKGNVKKVDEEQITQTVQAADKTKEADCQSIVKYAQKNLYNIDSILSQYGYSKKDNSAKSKKEYMKMNLLDGDYAIAYKNVPYIAEYHKDGTLMGLAKLDKKELTENKGSVVFYEYRSGYNTTSGMGLKHVLFLNFEKGKYISQYIYDVNGKLLCRQINNDIYVTEEARNMIPDWKKCSTEKVQIKYNSSKQYKKSHSVDIDVDKILCRIAGLPIFVAGIPLLIVPPVGIVCLFVGGIMLFDGGNFDFHH